MAEVTSSDLAVQVRYLRDVVKLSLRQIAGELGIPRSKCSRLYAGKSSSSMAKARLLDPYHPLIADWYREHPSLKAIQILERLRQRDVRIGYSAVKDFTREFREPKRKFYHTLEFQPGEEAQVDWFFLNHPHLGKLAGFALILSHSRYFFAHFFPRYSFEFFVDGHLRAFAALSGLPQSLRYDNLKSVVLKQKPLTYNPAFLEFAQYYRFEIRLCNVARPNEKGRIERAIRTLRSTFCNIAGDHRTLDALNTALHDWCDKKNNLVHRTTGKVPSELKANEPLRPFPQHAWRNALVLPAQQATKTGFVTFDTNRYSVPDYLVQQRLSIHGYCDHLEVYDVKGKKVATHVRCFARQQTITNSAHRSFARISTRAKRDRIHSLIKKLDPVLDRFLALNETTGEDPYATAHSLFVLLKSHARQTVISAVREALTRRAPRLKCVVSLLAPQPADDLPEVQPQRHELLSLNYQPRSLEDYE